MKYMACYKGYGLDEMILSKVRKYGGRSGYGSGFSLMSGKRCLDFYLPVGKLGLVKNALKLNKIPNLMIVEVGQ